ncbi:MAG: DUF4339 domain-containing protein, partial [Gemmatimonadaceae bacterium]|nr:DUF4339 domain-containing protein [Gemmatimonadaceae bacterium]
MATQWYYARNGQQQEPVSFEELQRLASNGQLAAGDLVWSEGMSNWSPASGVANLMPAADAGAGGLGAAGADVTGPVQPAAGMGYAAPPPPDAGEAIGYQGPAMGLQMGYGGGTQPPSNYLVQSILVTLCCCLP